jgi:hypothetical protein
VTFGWFLFRVFAVTMGAFTQVAFLAHLAGTRLSKWEHIAALTVLALPFCYADEAGPATPLPLAERGARRREALHAAAALVYLGLAAAVLVLAARGEGPRDLGFFVYTPAVGAVPVGRMLWRAARMLRRPPPPAPEPPFVGAYRTRPAGPPAPDPPVAPLPPPRELRAPRDPRLGVLGMALVSLAFVVAGVLMARHPHHPSDAFWGLLCALFFGLCAWVFVEQLAQPGVMLAKRAGRRVIGALILASVSGCWLSWTSAVVSVPERLMVGAGCAAMASLGVVALVKAWRRDRPRRAHAPRSSTPPR